MILQEPAHFPKAIDNTMRVDWATCPTKFAYSRLLNLDSEVPSIHLHAGAVFARGCEIFRKAYFVGGLTWDEALADAILAMIVEWGEDCPHPTWSWEYEDASQANARNKSLDRLILAIGLFFTEYHPASDHCIPLTHDAGAGIEFNFALPLPIEHPETGDPILYAGRFDMLGTYNGLTFGEDDKTTGQLGSTWADQWQLRSQFTGYTWAAREYGFDVQGFLIRGICFLAKDIKFAEAITYRPQWELDRWYYQLLDEVEDMIFAWKQNSYRMNLADSCNAYGGCPYRSVCKTKEPERWFDAYYTRRIWDPTDTSHERLFGYE